MRIFSCLDWVSIPLSPLQTAFARMSLSPSSLTSPIRRPAAGSAETQRSRARRAARLGQRLSPALVPCALAAGYLVLLIVRFPTLIGWENADSDIASAFTLTDAISHGHTGQVIMSTQGSWVPLWFGLLTHGLSFHRVLWEISPALLMLATAGLVGWAVARVSSRPAGALAVALIVAASPTTLATFTAAFFHNTTVPGTAILGAYLVWLHSRNRSWRLTAASVAIVGLVVGAFLASDELLAVVGLVPFCAVGVLIAIRSRDATGVRAVLATGVTAVSVAVITSAAMRAHELVTTTPGLAISLSGAGRRLGWLAQGLLRMGDGLNAASSSGLPTPVLAITTAATLGGLAATFWFAGRRLARQPSHPPERALTLHATFWTASLLCATLAYVLTTVASEPSDRYIMVAVPAVAAIVPLWLRRRRPRVALAVAAGATVVVGASLLNLARSQEGNLFYRGADVAQVAAIERVASALHLGVGYAGYWNASSLAWSSGERLHVYPVFEFNGRTRPMFLARAASWYAPRRHTASFVILAPGDDTLPDRLPADLPAPRREVRLGDVTMAIYPYDIASRLDRAGA